MPLLCNGAGVQDGWKYRHWVECRWNSLRKPMIHMGRDMFWFYGLWAMKQHSRILQYRAHSAKQDRKRVRE